MENTTNSEVNREFFVSVNDEIRLYCVWTDCVKREFYVNNLGWGSKFDESGAILCPETGLPLHEKGLKIRIHYFVVDSGRSTYKLQQAQQMLDNLNPEKKE